MLMLKLGYEPIYLFIVHSYCSLHLFCCSLIPALAIGSSYSEILFPLDIHHCQISIATVFSPLLLSDATSCFRLLLCICLLQS